MSNWMNNIYNRYLTGSIVEKIIYINITVFIATYLLNTLSFLFKMDGNFVLQWLALSPNIENLITKPWTLLTYGFLHSDFLHILFNLIFLFYIGNLFLDFFNKKQFLTYYLLGIITGGIVYIISYNYLPALKNNQNIVIGASAGVTAILIGITAHIPQYALRFRFIGSIKLMYIAIFFVALDIIQIPVGNTGGHIAHLGGALMGYLLTTYFNKGLGIIQWIENIYPFEKENNLKTVYKSKQKTKVQPSKNQQAEIDKILDKISKSGYETLSKKEKDFLFKAGKK